MRVLDFTTMGTWDKLILKFFIPTFSLIKRDDNLLPGGL